MSDLHFPGTVVVTGANGALGVSLISQFLKSGFSNIACQYRSSSDNIQNVFEMYGLDSKAHTFHADLTKEDNVVGLRENIVSRFGSIWGLVNLAGGSTNRMSWKLSSKEFQDTIAQNLLSAFLTSREFIPHMRNNNKGRIINVSSVVAHTGAVGAAHYCAAKAGVEGLTRALAQELAAKNITVNCLALGYFEEGLIRDVPSDYLEIIKTKILLGRLGKTLEIFPLIAYILDERSEFMTGQILHLNGGQYT